MEGQRREVAVDDEAPVAGRDDQGVQVRVVGARADRVHVHVGGLPRPQVQHVRRAPKVGHGVDTRARGEAPVGVVARRQLGAELEAAFRAILYPPPWYETPLRFLEWLHNRILTRAGLPTATRFHDLRHICATLLLTKGVHPKIVQEMLGHSSITITLDIYSHVLPNMQERAVSAMEDIFEGS